MACSYLIKKYLISQKVFEAKYVFEQMSKLVEFSIDNNTTIYKLEKQLGKLKNDFRVKIMICLIKILNMIL